MKTISYFVLFIVILGFATSEVKASMEYLEGNELNDIHLPPLTLTSFSNFIEAYVRLCKKLVGRKYNRPIHQPEADGPLTYMPHRIVGTNIFEDVWNAFYSWCEEPTEEGFWKIFAMWAAYYVIPFYGGYLRA